MSKTVKDAAKIFKALGDPTRLGIIKIIASTGNNLCVGFIANKLGVSQPAVSQHLKVLKNAGLVKDNRVGYHVHYEINRNCLEPYGIDTDSFFKSLETEFDFENCCVHKDKTEKCAKYNE